MELVLGQNVKLTTTSYICDKVSLSANNKT